MNVGRHSFQTGLRATLFATLLLAASCENIFGPPNNPLDPLNADKLTYKVTYDGNDQTGGTVPVDSTAYKKGDTATTLANSGNLAKTGYNFGGWSTKADGSGTNYEAGASTFTMAASDVKLHAKWDANTNTVIFNGNGATAGSMSNQTILNGQQAALTANGFSRTGYNFDGWNTSDNGTGDSYANQALYTMGSSSVTLYAHWASIDSPTPTGLSAVAGNQQVTLTWNSVSGATQYNVYYRTTAGVTPVNGNKLTDVTSPYQHSPLTNGTTYYYIVTAVNASAEESAASGQQSATPYPPPASPSGFTATADDGQVSLAWSAVSGATSYNLYWSTTTGVTTANGTKITGATSAYAHSGRTNGTTYYYIVTAVNGAGESTASTQQSSTPLATPGGVAATPGTNTQVTVSWSAASGASSYNLYWSTSPGVTTSTGTKVTGVTSPYTQPGLVNSNTYYYVVTAQNSTSESVASSQASSRPSRLYTYVANYTSGDVSAYVVNGTTGALTAVSGSPFATGSLPMSVYGDPSGKFLYVANNLAGTVSGYTINATTGALTEVAGSPFATDVGPRFVFVDPLGKFVYASNLDANTVSAYTINASTGVLTSVIGSPFATGAHPMGISADPSGKYAYVVSFSNSNVAVYPINASTGALGTAVAGSPFAAGSGPVSVTVDPLGKFAYVTNQSPNTVSGYTVNATTGVLTSVGSAIGAGTFPNSVRVEPSGKFAYVANAGSSNVSGYSINATTGVLTPLGTAFAAGLNPYAVSIDPSGKFAFVANYATTIGSVSAYTINSTTGALTAVLGSPFTAGTNPYSLFATQVP